MVSENKQSADIFPYPSNTMRSEKKSRSIIALIGWGGDLFHPRKHMQQLQSVRSHSPACEQLHQQRSTFKFLEILPISAHTHIDAWTHTMFPLWIRLFIRRCATSVIIKARCFSARWLGLFVNDTDTPHGTNARFRPRCSQCLSTKSPHWEDSARVTGGVNRRGGFTEARECARFMPRTTQEMIIKVGLVDVGWDRVCRTFVHQMRFYYVKPCSVIFKQCNGRKPPDMDAVYMLLNLSKM